MKINVPTGKPYFTGSKRLDGNTYRLTFRWNTTSEKWYLDITGVSNGVDIRGVALMAGKDLLHPHGYSELGQLWVIDGLDQDEDPKFESFGERHTLEYTPVA